MAEKFAKLVSGAVEALVRWVIVPVTGTIPFLVSSGILLVVFAAIWLGFAAGLVTNQAALDDAWRSMSGLPLPILGLAWLLFLPPMAGLWVWATDWPLVVRLVLIAGLAGWNILVFIPRRERPVEGVDKPAAA